MKYLKNYENINTPEVGDYVQIGEDYFDIALIDFFEENIGQLIMINITDGFPFIVKFDKDLPDKTFAIENNIMSFEMNEIVDWDKDKQKLEAKIISKKYNL